MAQKVNALIFFAAIEIALPSLSSLVASCKISESSAPQELRIKIQANIVPPVRRLPPSTTHRHMRTKDRAVAIERFRNSNAYAAPRGNIAVRSHLPDYDEAAMTSGLAGH